MKERLINIGRFMYLFTTIFGKTRRIDKIVIEENGVLKDEIEIPPNQFLVSFSMFAIIITIPLSENGFQRKPFIVKTWHKVNTGGLKTYIDYDNQAWLYIKDVNGEVLSFHDGETIYHLELLNK